MLQATVSLSYRFQILSFTVKKNVDLGPSLGSSDIQSLVYDEYLSGMAVDEEYHRAWSLPSAPRRFPRPILLFKMKQTFQPHLNNALSSSNILCHSNTHQNRKSNKFQWNVDEDGIFDVDHNNDDDELAELKWN